MATQDNLNECMSPEKAFERLKKEKEKGSRLIAVSAEERDGEPYLIYHIDQEDEGKIVNIETELEGKKANRSVDIYENADLYERECKEMYGLKFGEELRNLFLPKDVEEPPMSELKENLKKQKEEDNDA